MADKNCEEDQNWQNAGHDELDRELDAALAKYAAVEPRPGLEARVLANLRAQETQVAGRSWWRWGVGAILAAVIIAAIAISLRPSHPGREQVQKNPPVPVAPRHDEPKDKFVANREGNKTSIPGPTGPTAAHHNNSAAITVSATARPKLDRFPSPTPLSEQEKILANYVTQYPEHAALVAEARTEQLRRDEEEWHATDASNDSALTPNR